MVAMWSTADGHGGLADGIVVLWSTADGHGGLADGMVAMWSTTDGHDGLADGMVAMVVNGGLNGVGKVKCMKIYHFDNNVSFEEELVHQRLRKTLTHVLELSSCVYLDDRAYGVLNYDSGFPAQSIRSSNAIALDSPNLLVLNTGASQSRQHVDTSLIHIESRKSPTAELFDVDSGRISIRHCEY
nr:hypothetical protein [Tanacetum cinerariifolium]